MLYRIILFIFVFGTIYSAEKSVVQESATLVEVGASYTQTGEAFAARIRPLCDRALPIERARTGTSNHFVVYDIEGQPLGIFRRLKDGGTVEAELMVIDQEGFFGIPPSVAVTFRFGKEEVCGYLQRYDVSNGKEAPSAQFLLTEQLQKLGVLDILLLNEDRHARNILVKEGSLIPIDHNLSLLATDSEHKGLDLTKRLAQPPFWEPVIPHLYNEPLWLANAGRLRGYTHRPWTPAVRSFVSQWDVAKICEQLKERFGVSEGQITLMQAMDLWLKKGITAGLALDQIAEPVFRNRGIFEPIFHEIKTARFEEGFKFAGLEYDLLQAIELTRQQLRDGGDTSRAAAIFENNLHVVFDRRIALIQGRLSSDDRDAFLAEIWLNLFYREEIEEWRRGPNQADPMALPLVIDVLEVAKKLTIARFEREWGGVANGLRDNLKEAFYVHYSYFCGLYEAKPGTEEYLRTVQFLRAQIDRFDELLVSGVIWDSRQNSRMAHMPLSDVAAAIALAKTRARAEASYYQEQLGGAWQALVIPQLIDRALDDVQH